jgi:hypothetical protein
MAYFRLFAALFFVKNEKFVHQARQNRHSAIKTRPLPFFLDAAPHGPELWQDFCKYLSRDAGELIAAIQDGPNTENQFACTPIVYRGLYRITALGSGEK